jgi:hypothetical protein
MPNWNPKGGHTSFGIHRSKGNRLEDQVCLGHPVKDVTVLSHCATDSNYLPLELQRHYLH